VCALRHWLILWGSALLRNVARRGWSVLDVAPRASPRFQHRLNRPLLCTIVDMNFVEFTFQALRCIAFCLSCF
jgi:hypothetical protein